jgi:predicted transcriptional regulator
MSQPAPTALADKITGLVSGLGLSQDEIGRIVDASGRTVARWSAGKVTPQRLNRDRLLELAYVAEALTEVLPRDRANLWIFSPNQLLDHDTPAARIHDGQWKDVVAVIEAIADGIVV